MTVAAINCSPRGESSSSREAIALVERLGGADLQWTCVSRLDQMAEVTLQNLEEDLCGASVLLVTAPLYIDGLPATAVRALEGYRALCLQHRAGCLSAPCPRQRVFAVMNCGFYEGAQNRHALEMVEHFCRDADLEWCGGVGIGTGEMIRGLRDVPPQAGIRRPVVAALQALADAIRTPKGRLAENLYTQHRLPWGAYRLLGQLGWRKQVRGNGLPSRAVHARPHAGVRPR